MRGYKNILRLTRKYCALLTPWYVYRVSQHVPQRDVLTEEEGDARSAERTDADRRGRHLEDEIGPQVT